MSRDLHQMHARLMHAMKTRAHRPLNQIVTATVAEARERLRPSVAGIHSLCKDALRTLVYERPEAYEAVLENARRVLDAPECESTARATISGEIEGLQTRIDTLRKRMEGRNEQKIDFEIKFSKALFSFQDSVRGFETQLIENGVFDVPVSVCADIDRIDTEYRNFHQAYVKILGETPSYTPPDSYGPTSLPPPEKKIDIFKILFWGGAAVAAGYFFLRKRNRDPNLESLQFEPKRYIGPPQERHPEKFAHDASHALMDQRTVSQMHEIEPSAMRLVRVDHYR